ncbi:MAG TPA: RluA family pseudouridine synthase [Acidimicrobiales bacterium]|nr:RluA family pseudouridine synthase [Acidimicrobiales bacterium]
MPDEAPLANFNLRVEVSAALGGERVDRALAMITGRSRTEITDLIVAGGVFVNGHQVVVRHHRVAPGDVIVFDDEMARPVKELRPAEPGAVEFSVVYEDGAIIVIDKPAGLVVHPGAGHRDDTLASGLIARFPDLVPAAKMGAGDVDRPGIVHRLDKDTSGLLVVARTPEAYHALVVQLAQRTMGREYRALALGMFDNEAGTIEAPIGRSTRSPTKMTVNAGGREARTHYRVLDRFDQPIALSLVRLQLETGRTHQIRVHLAAIGHPVAGDERYGGKKGDLDLDRPFLHAELLRLIHPKTGRSMEWQSSLPADLQRCLERLHVQDETERPRTR